MAYLRRSIIPVWLLALVLGWSDLVWRGAPCPAGCQLYAGFLLLCYSIPFAALWFVQVPTGLPAIRRAAPALYVLIYGISLYLPIRRFLPHYRPQEFESLAYFFVTFLELPLIGLFVVVRLVAEGRARKARSEAR